MSSIDSSINGVAPAGSSRQNVIASMNKAIDITEGAPSSRESATARAASARAPPASPAKNRHPASVVTSMPRSARRSPASASTTRSPSSVTLMAPCRSPRSILTYPSITYGAAGESASAGFPCSSASLTRADASSRSPRFTAAQLAALRTSDRMPRGASRAALIARSAQLATPMTSPRLDSHASGAMIRNPSCASSPPRSSAHITAARRLSSSRCRRDRHAGSARLLSPAPAATAKSPKCSASRRRHASASPSSSRRSSPYCRIVSSMR